MKVNIEESWNSLLKDEFEQPYFIDLMEFMQNEYDNETVYPKKEHIFRAFNLCQVDQVKVVIIGQDPYHGEGEAHGLCFSVPDEIAIPPSLRNIFKELNSDLGKEVPRNGNLEKWANQGVLLMNAILTVRKDQAGSHQKKGWEVFTDEVIKLLSKEKEGLVFILWGTYAQKKAKLIDQNRHLIIQDPHPSPLSSYRGFFGSKPFSRANDYLERIEKSIINW
jgi:uracil-DNA glycosylase